MFGQRDLSRSRPRTDSDDNLKSTALQWEWIAAGVGGLCLFGSMMVLAILPKRIAGDWAPILLGLGAVLALPAYWTAQWKRADWNLRATRSDEEGRDRARRARILGGEDQ